MRGRESPVAQDVHAFNRFSKEQDFVKETCFTSVLILVAIRWLEKLDWSTDGCMRWYPYKYQTGVVRGVPLYFRHGRQSAGSIPVPRAVVKI